MKNWILSLVFVATGFCLQAQSAEDVIKSAREFSMKGDTENAILVLKSGLEKFPENADIRQELSMAYYTTKRNPQALETLKPLLGSPTADETVFQIAGLIYKSAQLNKDAEKTYKAGLKLHPKSGMLHNEYGLLMETMKPGEGESIKLWEKGIELDPRFAGNYYQATRYYSSLNNTIWTIIYGEMFANLDSYSNRSVEIKNITFQYYKKMFAYGLSGLNEKNLFEKTIADLLLKQKPLAALGLTPESLSAIRTRFVLDWFQNPVSEKYPFSLFDRHQQMLREGMFDAYNQWLFGGAANVASFQNWTKTHSDEYQAFSKLQRQKLFVVSPGQYYH